MQQDATSPHEAQGDEDDTPVTDPRVRAAHSAYSQASGSPQRAATEIMEEQPMNGMEEEADEVSAEEEESLAFEELPEEDTDSPLIAELQAKVAEQHEHLLRQAAEMDNLRKRTEREKEETGKYAIQKFARELAQVAENLIRATHSVGEEERSANATLNTLAEGVEMTLAALLKAFEKEQIERLYPEGETFDHRFHQAISQVDVPGASAGQVIQVVQAGYRLHDRLLQPALVVVAKGSTSA